MYQKSVLPNGIRVVSETIPYVKSVTLGIWVGCGSRFEDEHNHGISHFIEHLLFKGTTTRSARIIAESVDAVGGQLNAFTAKEYTCYYIKVMDAQLQFAMDILSDMLLNSLLTVQDIDRERQVVLEELTMYEDTPDELVHDLHVESIWANHQLGNNIIGTAASIEQFDRTAVLDYYKKFYTPDNVVIAAAGNVSHNALVEAAQAYFGMMQGRKAHHNFFRPQFHNRQAVHKKPTEQVHICLSSVGVPQDANEIYAHHICNIMLGGGVSSRLFQSIREECALAYSIYSYLTNYSDGGLLTIYAGTRPANTAQVIALIGENILQLKKAGISADELARVKEQLKSNLLLGLESSGSRMSRLGKMEISLGRYVTLDEVVNKIDNTTLNDVQQAIGGIFAPGYCLTALGPAGQVKDILQF